MARTPDTLTVDLRTSPAGEAQLRLAGALELATRDRLADALAPVLAATGAHLRVDAREVDVVDGAGLRMLLVVAEHARRSGGSFALVAVSDVVGTLVERLGLGEQLGTAASDHP